MGKEFNNIEEMKPYYNGETNTYEFMCNVQFNFNVNVNANINARDINALDINALDINANNINYYAVCFAYNNITCTSIKGSRDNAKHFVLDGKITIKPKTYKIKIDDKEIELSEESYNNFKQQFKEEIE